ncbi:MAG: choice-of-anchor F family protein [Desulfuromonadales bacterium]|nr:choice-of-anchor F family protein [Desulfuromonadales bacterium]
MRRRNGLWKKMGMLLGVMASAGLAQGATVTEWDTTNVQMYNGPVQTYSSYINTIHKDATFTYPTGGLTWKERDTQAPGLSIVNNDDKDGTNCIMSSGVNPYDGTIKQCSDPFQSSKRFKSLMYRSGEGTVLQFKTTDDGTVKTYRILQKVANWTGTPVKDFTLELGFVDANGNFIRSTAGDGLGLSSGGGLLWSQPTARDQVSQKDLGALFAHGLFGEPDKHHPEPGYFNPNVRAEFDLVVEEDRIVSNGISPVHSELFGQWQTTPIQIYGMYWDHDQLWYTDNILLANCNGSFDETKGTCLGIWETYRTQEGLYTDPETGELAPYPPAGVPTPISKTLLAKWAADPWVAPAPIDDFANINLNYFITVGSTAKWPTPGAFAVRITPNAGTVPPTVSYISLSVTSIKAPTAVK